MGSTVVSVVHVGPPRGVGKSHSFGRKETNFRDELHECNPNHRFGLHSVNLSQKLDIIGPNGVGLGRMGSKKIEWGRIGYNGVE